jgi:lipid-binding SYLF domain-containing protein
MAAIYSYSISKGLFAGVSLEGSVILERKDANEKFYGEKVSAMQKDKDLMNLGICKRAIIRVCT